MSKSISIETVFVVPSYEDNAVEQLIKDIKNEYHSGIYVVVVDDGSIKDRMNQQWLQAAGVNGCVVRLEKNVGHQAAIAVGLNYAIDNLAWEHLIVMDSDGEDTPVSSRQLLASLDSENVDIAVACRRSRVESFKFKAFYQIYKFVFFLLVGRTIRFGNFMAMRPSAAKRLVASPDIWQHLAACALNSNLRLYECSIDRGRRYSGESKMNFVSLVLHGFKGITVFFNQVLVRISIFCIVCAAIAVVGMIIISVLKVVGLASPGWFSTLSGILVLILFQVLIVGLISMLIAGSKRVALVNEVDYRKLICAIDNG